MKIFDFYHKFLKLLLIILFMVLAIVVTYQVLSRNVDIFPRFRSTEEISRWMFIWVIFTGAAIAVRENTHFVVDLFSENTWYYKYLTFISTLVMTLVSLLLIIIGLKFVQSGMIRVSPTSNLSLAWPYAALPFSGLSMLIFLIEKMIRGLLGSQSSNLIKEVSEEDS